MLTRLGSRLGGPLFSASIPRLNLPLAPFSSCCRSVVYQAVKPGGDSKWAHAEKDHQPREHLHDGRVACMIAASAGMGLQMCQRLLEDGASVMLSSRSQKNVDEALQYLYKCGFTEDRVKGFPSHGAQRESVRELLAQTKNAFGEIDYLYCGAGANPGKWALCIDMDDGVWGKLLDSNVKSSWMACQEVYPYMAEKRKGSIVFNASIAAYQSTRSGTLGGYQLMKALLLGLTKVMAEEMAPYGIRVNCIVPGIFYTKFATILHKESAVHDAIVCETLLKRLGDPKEVSGVFSFVCSDDASYMTSENLVIAGGISAHL